ncbi:MAG: TonB-dependent receptor [Chloracidobacterium sp.]|nr:TonB-dependent receptor [Chloracidobacterium sp.]
MARLSPLTFQARRSSDENFFRRSSVSKTEIQFVNNFTWVTGNHTMKFGGDFNTVRIPKADFELNFAALFNFGDFDAANLNPAFAGLPSFTPVQSYGLGLPSTYVQGFGNKSSKIKNTPIAFFGQDSWRATRRLTLNYGIRYDVELTETIAPVGVLGSPDRDHA